MANNKLSLSLLSRNVERISLGKVNSSGVDSLPPGDQYNKVMFTPISHKQKKSCRKEQRDDWLIFRTVFRRRIDLVGVAAGIAE